jgi:hypothetical protein
LRRKATSLRPKEVRQVKSKVKSMLVIFFDIGGIVHKEFVLAGQRVNKHPTVTFYGDCMKMYEDFALNFVITTTNHLTISFFTREFFTRSNMTVITLPPYFSLVST